MKIVLGLLVLVSCAHEPARVANPASNSAAAAGAPAGSPATPAAAARPARPAAQPASGDRADGLKIDRRGSVEDQLARLQDAYDRNAEAMDFLNKVYEQQKAQAVVQAEQRERE